MFPTLCPTPRSNNKSVHLLQQKCTCQIIRFSAEKASGLLVFFCGSEGLGGFVPQGSRIRRRKAAAAPKSPRRASVKEKTHKCFNKQKCVWGGGDAKCRDDKWKGRRVCRAISRASSSDQSSNLTSWGLFFGSSLKILNFRASRSARSRSGSSRCPWPWSSPLAAVVLGEREILLLRFVTRLSLGGERRRPVNYWKGDGTPWSGLAIANV